MKSVYAKSCGVIGSILLVAGVIGALILAYSFGVKTEVSLITYEYAKERDWFLTIVIFVVFAFYSVVMAVLFFAIKEILLYLEKIYTFEKNREEESIPPSFKSTGNYWICPKCGKENPNYTGTCGCGEQRP